MDHGMGSSRSLNHLFRYVIGVADQHDADFIKVETAANGKHGTFVLLFHLQSLLTRGNPQWVLYHQAFTPCPRFDAGVTSIQSHPYEEHLLALGRQPSSSQSKLLPYRFD